MNTLLRVLVIVIMVLGATALVFAIQNFNKRQILLGSRQALVEQVTNIAKTIEAQDATEGSPRSAMLDTSPVTDRVVDTVDKQDVFDGYLTQLETQNLPKLNFASEDKQDQLLRYYALNDDGTLKQNDRGLVNRGPGTMQELLDQLFERAKAQSATLDKTRAELGKKSDQVAKFVDDINKLKSDTRVVKKELTDTKELIAGLQADKAKLESNVAKLTSEKKDLQAEVADMKNEVETIQDKYALVEQELENKEKLLVDLRERLKGKPISGGQDASALVANVALTTGDKGKVVETNDEFKFAIIEFSADAMQEMLGPNREKQLPQLDMNIRRQGRESASGDFVTKVKLRHSVKDKNLVVADILTDWQQSPVEKGDVVWF